MIAIVAFLFLCSIGGGAQERMKPLRDLVNECSQVDVSLCTQGSAEVFESAMRDAQNLVAAPLGATGEQIAEVRAKLKAAFDSLECATDRGNLLDALDDCADPSRFWYTTESYNSYKNALKAADSVAQEKFVSQDAVDSAEYALREAFDGLQSASQAQYICYAEAEYLPSKVSHAYYFEIIYNNKAFKNNTKGYTNLGKVYMTIHVRDGDKYPSHAYRNIVIDAENDELSGEETLYVTENRGRYAGYSAPVKVKYRFKLASLE